MEQVDAEGDVGDDVEDRHGEARQAGVEVAVDRAAHEVRVDPAPREVGEVEGEEQQDDDPGPAHRAGGEVGSDVVPLGLVLHRSGPAVHDRQRVGGVEVQDEGADQHEAQRPQGVGARQQRDEQLAEELAVDVDVVDLLAVVVDQPEVHLEVADHVGDDEADADDARDGHHVLLADGRRVQVEEERLALLGRAPSRRPALG